MGELGRIQNNFPLETADILRIAQDSLRSLANGKGKTRRGRPSVDIPHDMLQLYSDFQFSLKKIGQICGASGMTIQRRIKQYDLKTVDYANVSDNELDSHDQM